MNIISLHDLEFGQTVNIVIQHIIAFAPILDTHEDNKIVGTAVFVGNKRFDVRESMHDILTKLPES